MNMQKKTVSETIQKSIDRCIEQMQLEGINILQLPEQFTAVLYTSLHKKYWGLDVDKPTSVRQVMEKVKITPLPLKWKILITGVEITKSPMLLSELEKLVVSILKEYTECNLEDCSSIAEVIEYMLDAIYRKGDRNYFFTPANIAQLMVELVDLQQGSFWDPACGSGTFLCKAIEKYEQNIVNRLGMHKSIFEGTDIDEQMVRISCINLFFHGALQKASVVQENSLEMPNGEKYDYIVANPPVVSAAMQESRGHIVETKALHLQFIQKIMESLKENGQAAVLVNEGFLFSERGAEKKIREVLVEEHGLHMVVSLPAGAFAPFTNAKSSILFFEGRRQATEKVFFYEAEHLGYSLDKKGKPIEENDIADIIEKSHYCDSLYEEWQRELRYGQSYNTEGIATPTHWEYKKCWFASKEQIQEAKYELRAEKYKPREKEELIQEAPEELLKNLFVIEDEIMKCLEQLSQRLGE